MIKKNKKQYQKTKFLLIVLAICGAFVLGYYTYSLRNSSNDSQNTANDSNQLTGEQKAKQEQESNIDPSKNVDDTSNTQPPVPTSILKDADLHMDVLEQKDGLVTVRASVMANKKGSCYFGFSTPDEKPVNRTTASQTFSETVQTCQISINEVEFTRLGEWTTRVVFTLDQSSAEVSQNVTIN
jgi:hypothetical protein